jgi:predicted unusual protein kinase regulating ubiquinone biosynthesis (AarF/ABC1/UbiB family)
VKGDAISPLARLDHDFTPVAEELTPAYLKGITLDGFFHADPHPGNAFVGMPGMANPFTPAEVVSDERRDAARKAATPLARQVATILVDMGEPATEFDRAGYVREISSLIARNVELTAS